MHKPPSHPKGPADLPSVLPPPLAPGSSSTSLGSGWQLPAFKNHVHAYQNSACKYCMLPSGVVECVSYALGWPEELRRLQGPGISGFCPCNCRSVGHGKSFVTILL
ncbi:Hypothetical predicted protein [Podarcis lilfordi]|uniref:Uncharacterized protein n=1 Tax=Podarcis lilfordi TaxID=74358 RepID=A0AA35JU58_9SAUR|nr:Hypothetical predicted protein [Podarcis lilfordi]